MIVTLISLASLALWASIATLVVTARDGYRQVPTLAP